MKKPEEMDKRKEDKQRSSFMKDRKISATSMATTTTTATTEISPVSTETKGTSTDISNSNFGSMSNTESSNDSLSTGTTSVPSISTSIELSFLSPSFEQTQGNLVSLARPIKISGTSNSVK